ncbi:MAG: Flp pilus assembly protein CpaB [Bdellovibrionales bacterium]|nr:Flp pilus assembly protein CpaB [Bdellovibrionales bacterium]
MNKNETLVLWLSIGLAIFAVMLVYSYTQEKSEALTKRFGAKTTLVVSTRDINEMETLDESMLELTEVPMDFAQPGHIGNIEDATGLVALAPIQSGEQILDNKIIKPGPVTGLSLQVTPKSRALTIPIDEMRGVAKLIKPGDRVDILAALDVRSRGGNTRHVKTILQNVVILATGLNVVNELPRLHEQVGSSDFIKNIRSNADFSSITIEAEPDDIQKLVYILSTSPGSLFLSLRHPNDSLVSRQVSQTTTIESILGLRTVSSSTKKTTQTRVKVK